MKITIQIGKETSTVETDGTDAEELIRVFQQCALGVGFHPDTIKQYFNEEM